MADVFYTILITWVLWRIFGGSSKSTVYHKQQYEKPRQQEGDVTVTTTSKSDQQNHNDRGEYVDYEEIK
ncbi:MAG: hypothetical protein ABI763_12560 [Bacteroidota bacterium]